jgi:hypothetical protein
MFFILIKLQNIHASVCQTEAYLILLQLNIIFPVFQVLVLLQGLYFVFALKLRIRTVHNLIKYMVSFFGFKYKQLKYNLQF